VNERRLEDVQDEILSRLHRGEPVDEQAILAGNPGHADALRQFLALLKVIEAPRATSASPGRLGDFEILREIGRGGMGVVYAARQVSLNRTVALKVLPASVRQDPRLLARFRREAEAAGRLRHPNIVPVYSIGEVAGTPFFAMELVEGQSLADVLRRRRAGDDAGLPPAGDAYRRWVVTAVARVADGLAYAHRQGILHRDIKPGNILVEYDGTPRITDFGLALDLQATELTQTGEFFGSPLYMSPEQALRREQPVDARTDIYSLAVTACELLTLQLPYHGTTRADVMAALAGGDIVPPRQIDPDLPEALERILLQALQRDPRQRYAAAADLAADLRRWLEDPRGLPTARVLPAAGDREARPRPTSWWTNRSRRTRIALGLLAIALVVVLAASLTDGLWGGQSASIHISGSLLEQLADGVAPDGEAILAGWIENPRFLCRRVVSREEPGICRLRFTMRYEGASVKRLVLVRTWAEASVDDGPFVSEGWSSSGFQPDTQFESDAWYETKAPGLGLATVLGASISKDMVTIRPRLVVRVDRGPLADGSDPLQGTAYTWVGEPRTVFINDRYPDGYPDCRRDPELDAAIGARFSAVTTHLGLGFGEHPYRSAQLQLESPEDLAQELPLAFEVDLGRVGEDGALGQAEFYPEVDDRRKSSTSYTLRFDQAPGVSETDWLDFLEEMRSGQLSRVHLRFRPSRTIALQRLPDCEAYWGGTPEIDVEGPFHGI